MLIDQLCMYIKGVVTVPWSVNYYDDRVRNTVYGMFDKNTADAVRRYVRRYRFRLSFQWALDDNNDTISIDYITCTYERSLPYFNTLFKER